MEAKEPNAPPSRGSKIINLFRLERRESQRHLNAGSVKPYGAFSIHPIFWGDLDFSFNGITAALPMCRNVLISYFILRRKSKRRNCNYCIHSSYPLRIHTPQDPAGNAVARHPFPPHFTKVFHLLHPYKTPSQGFPFYIVTIPVQTLSKKARSCSTSSMVGRYSRKSASTCSRLKISM